MHIFWNNIFKFPKFFLSVLLGFFLTIFNSIFELLRSPKQSIIVMFLLSTLFIVLMQILKLMLGLN